IVRRHLADPAAEGAQARLSRGPIGCPPLARRQLTVEVVGRRASAEGDHGAIRLLVGHVVLDEPRGAPDEYRQHASRERVERAAVSHAPDAGQAAHEGHDVVGGGAGRLVHDDDAVERAVARGAGSTPPRGGRAPPGRRASARKTGWAWATGTSTVAPAARA